MALVTQNGGAHFATTYSGNGAALTSLTRANLSSGSPNHVLVNDVTGAVSSIATLNPLRGGTGIDTSASTGVAKVAAGTWSVASIVNADIDNAASIARSKIAAGSASHVVVNTAGGALSSEAQLATTRGGTGLDTSLSTGVAKISTGTWSASAVVNADIDSAAAIARSKIASGTANHVVINGIGGAFSSEAQLAPARGGTGQDFSGVGVGPFVPSISSGVFSAVSATPNATASTYVIRDVSAGAAFGTVTATTVTAPANLTVSPTADLILDPTGLINTADSVIVAVPTTVAGGRVSNYVVNLSMSGAAYVTFWQAATTTNTAYSVFARLSGYDATGGTATAAISFQYRAKNIAGVVTKAGDQSKTSSTEAPIAAADARGAVSGTTLRVEVRSVAATTMRWCGSIVVVEQA